jgi:hypothetical protein
MLTHPRDLFEARDLVEAIVDEVPVVERGNLVKTMAALTPAQSLEKLKLKIVFLQQIPINRLLSHGVSENLAI